MVNTYLSAAEVVQLIRLADKAGRKRSPENNALVAYVESLLRGRVQETAVAMERVAARAGWKFSVEETEEALAVAKDNEVLRPLGIEETSTSG